MKLGLDHIQIAIPAGAEQTCRAFWGGMIGLRELEKPEALRARGGCWFALANAELHLGVEAPFSPAKKAHPGFRVTGINALAETLAAAGHILTWDDAIKTRARFFTEDPFGNRLEFLETN